MIVNDVQLYATLVEVALDLPILITSCVVLQMMEWVWMVDICLNCQVTHDLVESILVMSNPSLSHLPSVKSIIGLNVSVTSYKVP